MILLISLGGLTLLDYRLKLALFVHKRRTVTIFVVTIGLFIVWDIAGIAARIFFIGQNNYLLGLRVGEFPLEEIFFLLLLTYTSLITYVYMKRLTKP